MSFLQGQGNTITLPNPVPEGAQSSSNGLRVWKYNEQVVISPIPTKHAAAASGNYYSAAVTAGQAAVTSLVALTEASPLLVIENTSNAAVGTGPNIMLDYVRIDATAIAAAAVDWQYTWKLDNIRNKVTSGGTSPTAQNSSMGTANGSVSKVSFGALVVATAQQSSVSARVLAGGFLSPTGTAPVQIIGDMVDFRFGNIEAPLPTVRSNVASNGAHTFAMCLPVGLPPVILTPGTTATLFLWGTTSGSAPSYTLSAGWYEF